MSRLSRRGVVAAGASFALASLLPAIDRKTSAEPLALRTTTRVIDVGGRAATVLGIEGPSGFGGIHLMAGERFRVDLHNGLEESTLIHWHGQTPPAEQDGVPDLSRAALAPGDRVAYDFENIRPGTHWMHSHVGLQEQKMLSAPLIVREAQSLSRDEQEHVVMLHDFTFRDPAQILAELKAGGGAHARHAGMDMQGMDMADMDHSAGAGGVMLNDVLYDAYLANDRTIADPEVLRVDKRGTVLVRVIDAAAASNMWIELDGLAGELVAVDGNPVTPVHGSRFPLAVAQRADIRIRLPAGEGAWPILFRPEGVTQVAAIVLATGNATIARIPDVHNVAPALDLTLEEQLEPVAPPSPEPISRVEMVTLTGGGKDYAWGLNGKPMNDDTVFTVRQGERIAIMMHNTTAMAHPIHLHGHHFQVIAINRQKIKGAVRDTVLVPPDSAVTVAFTADNPGNWAFHCHHLYHMNAGMMGAIRYTSAA